MSDITSDYSSIYIKIVPIIKELSIRPKNVNNIHNAMSEHLMQKPIHL